MTRDNFLASDSVDSPSESRRPITGTNHRYDSLKSIPPAPSGRKGSGAGPERWAPPMPAVLKTAECDRSVCGQTRGRLATATGSRPLHNNVWKRAAPQQRLEAAFPRRKARSHFLAVWLGQKWLRPSGRIPRSSDIVPPHRHPLAGDYWSGSLRLRSGFCDKFLGRIGYVLPHCMSCPCVIRKGDVKRYGCRKFVAKFDRSLSRGNMTAPSGEEMSPPVVVGLRPASRRC